MYFSTLWSSRFQSELTPEICYFNKNVDMQFLHRTFVLADRQYKSIYPLANEPYIAKFKYFKGNFKNRSNTLPPPSPGGQTLVSDPRFLFSPRPVGLRSGKDLFFKLGHFLSLRSTLCPQKFEFYPQTFGRKERLIPLANNNLLCNGELLYNCHHE